MNRAEGAAHRPDRQRLLRAARLRRLLLGAATLLLVFRDALRPSQMLLGHDTYQLLLPLKAFIAEQVRQGHWPRWYPFDGLGVDVAGSFVAGLWDPLNLLLGVLRPVAALKAMVLLCYPVAAWGTARLARALGMSGDAATFAGLCFACSGVMLSQSVSLQYLGAFSRLPWVLWAAVRLAQRPRPGRAAVLGVALASTLWSGDPESLLVGAAVVGVGALVRARRRAAMAGLLLLGAAMTALLCAPILLPALHTFSGSARQSPLSPEEMLAWSVHPLRLAELVVGSPFLSASAAELARYGGQNGTFWSQSEYLGAAVAGLGLFGLRGARGRWLGAGAALALVLALGDKGALYAHLPLLTHFRYPEKLTVWVALPVALLAGRGLVRLGRRAGARPLVPALAAVVGAGGLSALVLPAFGPLTLRAAAVVALVGLAGRVVRRRPRMWLVLALALAEVGAVNRGLVLVGPERTFLPPASPIPEARPGERICSDLGTAGYALGDRAADALTMREAQIHTLAYGLAGLYRLRSTLGLIPVWPADLVALCSVLDLCGTPCARLEGARLQWVQRPALQGLLASGEYRLVRQSALPEAALVEDLRAPGYVSVVPARGYSATFPTLAALHTHRLPAGDAALVDQADAPDLARLTGQGTATLLTAEPGLVEVEAEVQGAALLVVREAFSHGWEVTVDGASARPLRVDFAVLGVVLEPGRHRVVARYRPFGERAGWAAYAAGMALCALAMALGRARR